MKYSSFDLLVGQNKWFEDITLCSRKLGINKTKHYFFIFTCRISVCYPGVRALLSKDGALPHATLFLLCPPRDHFILVEICWPRWLPSVIHLLFCVAAGHKALRSEISLLLKYVIRHAPASRVRWVCDLPLKHLTNVHISRGCHIFHGMLDVLYLEPCVEFPLDYSIFKYILMPDHSTLINSQLL